MRGAATILIFGLLSCGLAACASSPTAADAPGAAVEERRLERPGPAPTLGAGGAADPGEAALAESLESGAIITEPSADDIVIVPGRREDPVAPIPGEDPRTPAQRAEDRRAWDRCVTAAQRRIGESGPGTANPVQDTPESLCAERLGMASRNAIPESRRLD